MNITLEDPQHTPVYYHNNNPYNNLRPTDGRPWCFKQAVITGAQVTCLDVLHPLTTGASALTPRV